MSTSSNITTDTRALFEALTSGEYSNFALFSCFCNGEPASAIVTLIDDGESTQIIPLFISVTPAMVITDHDEKEPSL